MVKQRAGLAVQSLKKFIWEHRLALLQGISGLILFLFAVYRLSEVGQPILFNDEIGYWSNSAFFMGDDWTSVTGQIGYYSYGYSLLLIPLRLLAGWLYWSSDTLYHAGVILNGMFLVMSYVIALRLAKRYLPELNQIVRIAACFTVCTYSTYLVYAHITWTECTLLFFFWVFLYVMMRLTDHPTVGNHIAFAVIPFYMYTVHQRALGIVVTAVLVVLLMRLFRLNRMRDTAVFLGCLYLYSLVHAMVKWNLQHVNYLGEEPEELRELAGHAFTRTSGCFLVAGISLLVLLYLIEKRKYKILLILVAVGVFLTAAIFWHYAGGVDQTEETSIADMFAGSGDTAPATETRISRNDFSGQWGVIRNLFTVSGLLRLGISMVGKWFYLASVSGLVICWGLVGLFQNAFFLCRDTLRRTFTAHRERLWFLGLLLAWLSSFMISAIYKEGFYKNDDLFNGRYVEFTIGFLLLYSLNCLINDKKWVRKALLIVVLYIAAGHLCQNAIDVVGRTEFELAHCVMFGRMVWNYEVPVGKVRVVEGYILPLTAAFFVVLKPARTKIPRLAMARTILALMIPVAAWTYLGKSIVDNYVVVRNEKQAEPLPQFATWINVLGGNGVQKVYYILDSANPRYPGALQYMLQDKPVTVAWLADVSFTEDAFYVVHWNIEEIDKVKENCETVMSSSGYMLLINKEQELMEQWRPFMD